MKIATWNVNSIAVRLPQVSDWIEGNRPDVLCLQEIKCVDEKFPAAEFEALGYRAEIYGQPTYNGVAILSLKDQKEVQRGLPGDGADAQRRLIASTIGKVRIINVYVPNGSEVGSDKYHYKLGWLGSLSEMLNIQNDNGRHVVLCGDFNIAPEDRDVHDPVLWAGKILCSEEERRALKNIQDWGFVDVVRKHRQENGLFSWWDYRGGGFRRNHGLRIDHVWATESLAARSLDAWIDKIPRAMEKPSDHAPVVAEFAI
ncbi:MAG: exodeoxyribonuclease III [Acidobacteriota bacterium]|nr:MAG: exodeoxyribonuclease III [Acidobacteriota bacterium]